MFQEFAHHAKANPAKPAASMQQSASPNTWVTVLAA
jgi:hypothetical protein